ncbi:MAG: efflux transporter outer membrane subunit [Bacteroidales bacterium]|nr:efflux transporter outer membrane subunit [Bacteroidales bacterium]
MRLFVAFLTVATAALNAFPESDITPEFKLPGEWTYVDTADPATESPCQSGWWRKFEDPLLDSLINRGIQNNYNVAAAARRIAIARASVGSARAGYYPVIGVSGGYTKSRSSGDAFATGGDPSKVSHWDLGASLSWEIDVFGRVRKSVEVGKSNVSISRADRAGVELALQAEIATAYINLRVEQAQLNVANEHSQRQHKALNIAEARFETGLASMLDVDQARQVYYSTIASIPMLENSIHADISTIATLLGVTVGEVESVLAQPRPLPSYFQLVQSGVPADLLDSRPDVVAAARTIDMYASRLGIAKKEWLPTVSVNASAGTLAHDAKDLFTDNSFNYSIAPTISWTVFDGLARKYNIISAREQLQEAVDNYNQTVLTAIQEADNAMSAYRSYLKYIKALDDVVASAAEYDTRSLDSYKNGLTPYINVANAQMSYLEDMNTLIVAKGNALNALVSLYKALGGGWRETEQ